MPESLVADRITSARSISCVNHRDGIGDTLASRWRHEHCGKLQHLLRDVTARMFDWISADRAKLEHTVEQLKPRLLVLDPFVRLHRIDENASGEVAPCSPTYVSCSDG